MCSSDLRPFPAAARPRRRSRPAIQVKCHPQIQARAVEHAHLAAFGKGNQQVDDLDSRFQHLDLNGLMGGDIGLEAASMSFYALDMPGMDDPMPLYDDPDVARIEAGVVTFDKTATPIAASHWSTPEGEGRRARGISQPHLPHHAKTQQSPISRSSMNA